MSPLEKVVLKVNIGPKDENIIIEKPQITVAIGQEGAFAEVKPEDAEGFYLPIQDDKRDVLFREALKILRKSDMGYSSLEAQFFEEQNPSIQKLRIALIEQIYGSNIPAGLKEKAYRMNNDDFTREEYLEMLKLLKEKLAEKDIKAISYLPSDTQILRWLSGEVIAPREMKILKYLGLDFNLADYNKLVAYRACAGKVVSEALGELKAEKSGTNNKKACTGVSYEHIKSLLLPELKEAAKKITRPISYRRITAVERAEEEEKKSKKGYWLEKRIADDIEPMPLRELQSHYIAIDETLRALLTHYMLKIISEGKIRPLNNTEIIHYRNLAIIRAFSTKQLEKEIIGDRRLDSEEEKIVSYLASFFKGSEDIKPWDLKIVNKQGIETSLPQASYNRLIEAFQLLEKALPGYFYCALRKQRELYYSKGNTFKSRKELKEEKRKYKKMRRELKKGGKELPDKTISSIDQIEESKLLEIMKKYRLKEAYWLAFSEYDMQQGFEKVLHASRAKE